MALIEKYVFRPGCCDVIPENGGQTTVIGPCHYCGVRQEIVVDSAALLQFRDGRFAQDVFFELSPGEREFLISGICDTCWDKMFGSEPEREESGAPHE